MMKPERWTRLKEIVADALEEDSPAARTARLSRDCAGDPELLREAESFFQEADHPAAVTQDTLEECAEAAGAAIRQQEVSMTGRRIGAYVIVRQLGRGGMATVYLAARADGYFEKQVAIKVLEPGGGHSRDLLGRFRGEREVLASLEHPNIAALFDAGTTEEGLPYFVMEYVPGTPVTAYIREHQLPIRARLDLFLKVCAAVEAAHRKRIVHRDLKRSNILVNEEGEPKLLDFGIAKLLGENPLELTATGQQRLTPISASPEQARGEEVTRASDIYALGALLYEMLTDHTPHVFATRNPSLNEVTRVITEERPVAPSELVAPGESERTLRGDLDAIVLRAMQKEPGQRYASVADLGQDIRRYLAGEPVHARAATLPYRLVRFAGRHPLALRLASVALVMALLLGIFLYFVPWPRSKMPANHRVAEGDIPPKSIAVLPFDDFAAANGTSYFADGVQDDILTDLAKVEELKVISRSGAWQYRTGVRDVREIRENLGVAYVLEGSVRRMQDRVRVNAQLIDTKSDVQVWAEQYDRELGDLFALQSDLSQAVISQLKAHVSKEERAAIERHPTKDAGAYDLYLQARADFLRYRHREVVELLEKAVGRDPNFALAYCLLAEANLYIYRFDRDPSPERLERANKAATTALRLAPDLPEAHLAKAQYYYNGLRDYEKTLAELAAAPPSSNSRARFFDLTALAERRLGNWQDALRDGRKALELDPHDPFVTVEVIQTYMALRLYPEAENLAAKATKLFTVESAPFWSHYAESILAQGEPGRANAVLAIAPPKATDVTYTKARLALYERDYEKALQILDTVPGDSPLVEAMNELLRGTAARAQEDDALATKTFTKAKTLLEGRVENGPDRPITLINLALAEAGLGHKEEALSAAQEAVQLVPTWRDAVDGPMLGSTQIQVQTWLGETESAIRQLAKLVKHPGGPSYGELKLDPMWDGLRGDPRFAEILAEASRPILFQ